MEKSSGQEINVVISDMSLYPVSLYPKFTVYAMHLESPPPPPTHTGKRSVVDFYNDRRLVKHNTLHVT